MHSRLISCISLTYIGQNNIQGYQYDQYTSQLNLQWSNQPAPFNPVDHPVDSSESGQNDIRDSLCNFQQLYQIKIQKSIFLLLLGHSVDRSSVDGVTREMQGDLFEECSLFFVYNGCPIS